MNDVIKVETMLGMLLFAIISKSLHNTVSVISLVLVLTFGEASTFAVDFKERSDSQRQTSSDNISSSMMKSLLDLKDRSRFALLRAMSMSLQSSLSTLIVDLGFLHAYVEAICKSMEGSSQGATVYCIDSMSTVLYEYLSQMHDGLVSTPLLSREILLKLIDIALYHLDCEDLCVTRTCQNFLNLVLEISVQHDRCFCPKVHAPDHLLSISAEMHTSKKAKYRVISMLLQYMDASDVLVAIPNYVDRTIKAISFDKGVRKAAMMSLKPIWKSLHPDCDAETLEKKQTRHTFETVIDYMIDANEEIRVSTLASIIPGLLEVCPGSFMHLLHALLRRQASNWWLGSCLGLLTAGRNYSCFLSLESLENEGIHVYELLDKAIQYQEEKVQVSALQLLVAGNASKTIDVPNRRVLDLTWKYYNMAMRCTSASVKQENLSCYGRLLARIKISVAATLTRPECFDQEVHDNVKLCELWIQSFCRLCISCLHPGSVHGKQSMAIELLCTSMEAFDTLIAERPLVTQVRLPKISPYSAITCKDTRMGRGLKFGAFSPFPAELYSDALSNLLYSALTSNWDRVRSLAMHIILMLPSSFSEMEELGLFRLVMYAFDLLQRPRLSDLEAGSRILSLVYQKYIQTGLYSVTLTSKSNLKVEKFMEGSCRSTFLKDIVVLAKSEMMPARSSIHGDIVPYSRALSSLASLRYLMSLMCYKNIEDTIDSLHEILQQSYELVMPILASPEDSIFDVDIEQDNLDDTVHSKLAEEQMIRNKAWRVTKEICYIIEKVWEAVSKETCISDMIRSHLNAFTDMIIQILLNAKHYGTIDYSRETLEKICSVKLQGDETSIVAMDTMFAYMLRSGQTRRDTNRRSGGLPYGIHSIMVANPKSYLTIKAMSRLIDVYNLEIGVSIDSHWPKVHALNSLCPIFSDSRLSSLEQFYGISFKIILSGLSDSSWEIQNSAALCFTALVSRVMGFANVRRENHVDLWPYRSPTAREFFDAYIDVERFILDRLQLYGSSCDTSDDSDALIAPVLGLLGRLRPSCYQTREEVHLQNIEAYSKALIQMLDSREIKIRKMAARAFVSVVPLSMWSGFCREQSESISQILSDEVRWNTIHGRLCAMTEILKALYSIMEQHHDIDRRFFVAVCHAICDGIDAEHLPLMVNCPPVGAEFLKICLVLCRLEHKWGDEKILKFNSEVVLKVMWQPLMALGRDENMLVPMLAICLKRMVKLAFVWCFPKLIQTNDWSFIPYLDNVSLCLNHSYYEVREAALKSVLHSFRLIKESTVDREKVLQSLKLLYGQISDSWTNEKAYHAKSLIVAVLNVFHANTWELCKEQGVFSIDASSVQLYSDNPSILYDVIVAHAYSTLSRDPKYLEDLLALLNNYSKPEFPEEIRLACVHSLDITKALVFSASLATDAYITEYVGFWNLALTLLEDEDANVRFEMTKVIQKVMSHEDMAVVRVEHMQQSVMPWLNDTVSSHPAFIRQLQSWICRPDSECTRFIEEFESRKRQKLFLAEKANQHEDPMVFVNLASIQLASLTLGPDSHETLQWLDASSKSLLRILEYFEKLERDSNEVVCQYLDMYASCAYQHIYRLWAAVWSSSQACLHKHLPPSMACLRERMKHVSSVVLRELFLVPDLASLIQRALAQEKSSHGDSATTFPISCRLHITI